MRWLQNVDDLEKRVMMQRATALVFPSLLEGFGLPVLESLAFKRPIIVSDIPVFRELFSDLVLFSTLNNNGNLRGTIKELLKSLEVWNQKLANMADLNNCFSYKKAALLVDKTVQNQG